MTEQREHAFFFLQGLIISLPFFLLPGSNCVVYYSSLRFKHYARTRAVLGFWVRAPGYRIVVDVASHLGEEILLISVYINAVAPTGTFSQAVTFLDIQVALFLSRECLVTRGPVNWLATSLHEAASF